MPPKRPTRQARSSGNDPTASITAAANAKSMLFNPEEEPKKEEVKTESNSNDDLKKLIETLKSKIAGNTQSEEKKVPPAARAKTVWNRSVDKKETNFKPAYTLLTRISNHEKVPLKSSRVPEFTTKSLPDSFLYRPGVDGITIGKVEIKAGKQLCIG